MSPAGGSSPNSTGRNVVRGDAVVAAVVVEGAHPQPLGAAGRGRRRRPSAAGPWGSARFRRAARRSRRSSSGRPRPGRWSTRPRRPPRRRRPPGSATTPSAPAGARSSARPTVIGLPDRLASTVAPASAASALGGTGTHMSSQISTCSTRPGRSVAAKSRSGPNGTSRLARRAGSRPARRRPRRTAGARRTRGRSAGTTSAPRRAPGRGGSRPRSCRSGAGGAAARRRRAPAAGRPRPRRRRAARPRPRRAARPAAGGRRSSSRTASAPGRPPARRRRRGSPGPTRSTDAALAAGSAMAVCSVQAATRTKPWR